MSGNHPLTPNLQDMTDADLAKKIQDLNKRVVYGYQMANPHLLNQIRMMLEDYNEEQRRRDRKRYEAAMESANESGKNWDDIIDI